MQEELQKQFKPCSPGDAILTLGICCHVDLCPTQDRVYRTDTELLTPAQTPADSSTTGAASRHTCLFHPSCFLCSPQLLLVNPPCCTSGNPSAAGERDALFSLEKVILISFFDKQAQKALTGAPTAGFPSHSQLRTLGGKPQLLGPPPREP